jgi:hypothetical protein
VLEPLKTNIPRLGFNSSSLSSKYINLSHTELCAHLLPNMHSTLVRLQNVFGFFTTVAFTVATVIALSSFITPQNPSASIQLRNVQVVKGRPHYYSPKREEYAHVRFDLDAGTSLTSLTSY